MEEKGICVLNVSKAFGNEVILDNINLKVAPGHACGIVGNNGSGKTVLMKCICGFLKPDSGEIYVNGSRIGREVDFPVNTGIIIETPGFIPNVTGFKNLKILASLQGKISREDIKNTMSRVGLDYSLKKHVSKYSLGMRQRLGIAQAIMEEPDVLVLDEPFNGLDKNGVKDMHDLIKELKAAGKAILLASHSAKDIEELCDEVFEIQYSPSQSLC